MVDVPKCGYEEDGVNIRHFVPAAILTAAFMVMPARAQEPFTTDQVKSWSLRQWNRAKTEFAKDKDKWTSCREQGKQQKLRGRASWQFLYGCMKS
jgi:hypothetical protein